MTSANKDLFKAALANKQIQVCDEADGAPYDFGKPAFPLSLWIKKPGGIWFWSAKSFDHFKVMRNSYGGNTNLSPFIPTGLPGPEHLLSGGCCSTKDGSLIALGQGGTDGTDVFLTKIKSDGSTVWTTHYPAEDVTPGLNVTGLSGTVSICPNGTNKIGLTVAIGNEITHFLIFDSEGRLLSDVAAPASPHDVGILRPFPFPVISGLLANENFVIVDTDTDGHQQIVGFLGAGPTFIINLSILVTTAAFCGLSDNSFLFTYTDIDTNNITLQHYGSGGSGPIYTVSVSTFIISPRIYVTTRTDNKTIVAAFGPQLDDLFYIQLWLFNSDGSQNLDFDSTAHPVDQSFFESGEILGSFIAVIA